MAMSCGLTRSPSTAIRGLRPHRPCRPAGTRWRSDVRRLRGNAEQHERRHPQGCARAVAANGRMAANGAQRTGGQINEMSKLVYTTCNPCAKDLAHPPLWQIRAASAVQDLEHKKIEYHERRSGDLRVSDRVFPVFLERRSVGEAGKRAVAAGHRTSSALGVSMASPGTR